MKLIIASSETHSRGCDVVRPPDYGARGLVRKARRAAAAEFLAHRKPTGANDTRARSDNTEADDHWVKRAT